ncbi:hypothetical protein TrRE_jg6829 [Triparma retinervis]|uniref:Zinc-ribbon domain-containing protein n=1 Tax=Triparma retinervis TaxID=2557542 RepID=A0A9W6Z603_9STRA|nr:hypothetical protein TrRE_jg6829 [Triparma retinervis]
MGTCSSGPDDHAEAEMMVPGGADAQRACFLLCLKVDLYQPKYANHPMVLTMTPCPTGAGFVEGYGVGTVFEGTNAGGQPERTTITELVPLEKIVMETRGIFTTFSTSLDPSGACKLQFAYDGEGMGVFTRHVAMQVNTMGAFVKANMRAILDEASSTASSAPPPASNFCGKCGAQNSGTAFCPKCGAPLSGGGGPAFVEVAEHKQGQQAAQNFYQESVATAAVQATSNHRNYHHNR